MLNKDDILNQLKDILVGMDSKNAEKMENLSMDTKLVTELGLSSVSMLYLVIAIEETFNVEFDNEKPFETVGEVVDFIAAKA